MNESLFVCNGLSRQNHEIDLKNYFYNVRVHYQRVKQPIFYRDKHHIRWRTCVEKLI